MARPIQINGLRSSDGSAPGSTRAVRNPRPRRSIGPYVRIVAGCLTFGAAVAAGVWAYPRYLGGNKTCLLPTPSAPGAAITVGTPTDPRPVVYGQLAILEQAGNPLRFKVIPSDVEIRGVHYAGHLVGTAAIPEQGAFRILKVNGKSFPLHTTAIEGGCVNLRGPGKAILLFSGSFAPAVTLVLTPDQMKWFE